MIKGFKIRVPGWTGFQLVVDAIRKLYDKTADAGLREGAVRMLKVAEILEDWAKGIRDLVWLDPGDLDRKIGPA